VPVCLAPGKPKLFIDGNCDPSQIGLTHGSEAKHHISRCIAFYAGLFKTSAAKDWSEVQELAMSFEPAIRKNWPAYLEEMEGR
jgi:isopenicillin-N N-acyltransferase-like protein